MIRNLSIALFTFVAACATNPTGTPGTDELAGENGQDGDQSKADAAHDNFTFIAVEKDAVTCGNPIVCTPYRLTRVNRSSMMCNDNQLHASCKVKAVSFSKFSQATQNKIAAAIEAETSGSATGVQVLVRGNFKIYVDFLAFEATDVWLAQRPDGDSTGTFVRIFDRGIRCITAPCPQFEEGRLNSSRSMTIDGIDFGDATTALQNKIYDATTKADGVIVVGDRTMRSAVSFVEKMRTVGQAYLPVK